MEIIAYTPKPVSDTYSITELTEDDLITISHIKLCWHKENIDGCSQGHKLKELVGKLDILARRYVSG